ncbi:MAG: amidophosphoribosyltransferase [Verrucomicrobiales bacterium]|nr:amidophosphoribosyltransferase [Verrucomicrobiales bacterium]
MSDSVKHECGLAFVRLKHDLSYYHKKYGTCLWGFQRLYLLMEKQHNRGQDGIGIGCCKLNMPLGQAYLFRERSAERDSLIKVMETRIKKFRKLERDGVINPDAKDYPKQVKENFKFGGEVLLGHLRYGTSGAFGEGGCHPFVRRTNWPTKSLMVAGNFNMTNARDLNHHLINRGQHPVFASDTQTVLEEIGYHLDVAHDAIYRRERDKGTPGRDIPAIISDEIDMNLIMEECGKIWDGGYTIGGVVGNGDAFVLRDPCGIRPCHYYEDDEVIAFASERVPLMTVFSCEMEDVSELPPGNVAVIKHRPDTPECELSIKPFCEPREVSPCSFERIYFSRPNDPEIYRERKALGAAVLPQIIKSIDDDLANTVFSFIPNTAEIAYHGMMASLREFRRGQVRDKLLEAQEAGTLDATMIDDLIMRNWPRAEKIAHKDIKLRTFISQEKGRDQMVSHVYDISYGVVKAGDNLVVMDDSIVRGTTLQKSILKILARTNPKKIVIVSTAPQIRYPDCYGIDMSELGKFIAFRAAINVLTQKNKQSLIADVHEICINELKKNDHEMINAMKLLYEPLTDDEISAEISRMVRPVDIEWEGEIEVIYQTIENLHKAIPVHNGDWYFTGNYPTPGGNRVANQSLVSHLEGDKTRPYDMLL